MGQMGQPFYHGAFSDIRNGTSMGHWLHFATARHEKTSQRGDIKKRESLPCAR